MRRLETDIEGGPIWDKDFMKGGFEDEPQVAACWMLHDGNLRHAEQHVNEGGVGFIVASRISAE